MKKFRTIVDRVKTAWLEVAALVITALGAAAQLSSNNVFAATTTATNRGNVGMVQLGIILLVMLPLLGIGHRMGHWQG
ncbi:hypothetical protein PQ472_07375 [Lacticaseibacillus pabuli]|uniref:Uncharacterized protein n=1 Tax=Lacticaseibacillus pabuli TaxID=3025672 RepID=A0ABY7WNG1_9LACO|nr:hypothetical protein [Lacticaseibacillus sp. KACC 23028]WDF81747.1 hypothetical protein PQ472_07375 [Lacticaseibacillus sp. KACC 23028]